MKLEAPTLTSNLPPKLYRGLLMLTCSWTGTRVSEGSLLIKVHDVPNATKLPLIWCGGPVEMPAVISVCGQQRNIYALRGTYEFVQPTHNVITALSRYYADEIERTIAAKSYLIAGNCAAAYIAIEIAEVLHNRGCHVGFLGIVERDVSVNTFPLKVARKIYTKIDRIGTLTQRFLNAFFGDNSGASKIESIKKMADVVIKKFKKATLDSRTLIQYKSLENDKTYQLKQYHDKISLIFVSWGVFGFYRFNFFQKYWRKLAPKGITVDIINGFSHENPPWVNIIKALNKRLVEAGY